MIVACVRYLSRGARSWRGTLVRTWPSWTDVASPGTLVRKLGPFFVDSGVFSASWLRPEALPAGMEVLCVFPEVTEGNCKSLVHAHKM